MTLGRARGLPKSLPEGIKNACQKTLPKRCQNYAKMEPKGSQNGPKMAPKWEPKRSQTTNLKKYRKQSAKGGLQVRPASPRGAPAAIQGDPGGTSRADLPYPPPHEFSYIFNKKRPHGSSKTMVLLQGNHTFSISQGSLFNENVRKLMRRWIDVNRRRSYRPGPP